MHLVKSYQVTSHQKTAPKSENQVLVKGKDLSVPCFISAEGAQNHSCLCKRRSRHRIPGPLLWSRKWAQGFSGGSVGENPPANASDVGPGRIPRAVGQLSQYTTTEPVSQSPGTTAVEPTPQSPCSATREAIAIRSPHTATRVAPTCCTWRRESPCAATKSQCSQK